jgi:DNA polymerase III gamma/tau subunit
MANDVLALKYRPKKLSEIIGQDPAVQMLTNAFTSGKMYQTLVFAGNYGCGKTSSARVVAAMDNCEKGPSLEPCGVCKNCLDIFAGKAIDVKEMNAAKSRGIDDIRAMEEYVREKPLNSRMKYVILDECLDYHSRIDTENGRIEIGLLVNEKRDVRVKSFDSHTKCVQYRKITGYFKNSGKDVYRLKFNGLGVLLASENHLISTPEGYKTVGSINVGDTVHRIGYGLTESQKQMLLGCLLGDASVTRNKSKSQGWNKNSPVGSRIRFVQCAKQEAYLRYKHERLGSLSGNFREFSQRYSVEHPFTQMFRFGTRIDASLSEICSLFINRKQDGRNCKTVSPQVFDLLDWQGAAYWFCDDGSISNHTTKDGVSRPSAQLHTSGFIADEQLLCQSWFVNRGINAQVKTSNGYFCLYFSPDETLKLLKKIAPFVHSSMRYKAPGFESVPFVGVDLGNHNSLCKGLVTLKENVGYRGVTYDIEVEGNHNYFASGTLVHNCHRLTPDAAESALKLFEEPPKHVRYVLATTDLHKMKITLQSRAMTFRFVKVPWPILTEHLASISKMEKYNIDEAALKVAAKLSDGSVRNSLRNLQMLDVFSGTQRITVDLAQQALGGIDDNQFFTFVDAVANKDAATSMKVVNAILAKGVEFQQIFDGLLEHLRTLLVVMTCHNTATLVYLSEEEKKGYIHQIGVIDKKLSITDTEDKQRSAAFISTMISLLCSVARIVALNVNPQTLLEQYAIESIMTFGKLEREAKAKT